MPLFENQVCPVCKRQFETTDDVVYCPECGTPHHRECYNLIGHCVNRNLHAADYSYFEEQRSAAPAAPPVSSAPAAQEFEEMEDDEPITLPFTPPAVVPAEYENSRDSIDGESVTDIASAVRTNIPRFIASFKRQSETGKKLGWNWGAFFFGSLYYLYRKMFRQGIALLCLMLAVTVGASFAMTKLAPQTTALMQEAVELSAQNDADGFTAILTQVQNTADMKNASAVMYGFLGLILFFRIMAALLADRLYKNTVFSLIRTVGERLEDGASFRTGFFSTEEPDLSQEQLKRLYLARKGGISFFAPLAAVMIVDLLFRLI